MLECTTDLPRYVNFSLSYMFKDFMIHSTFMNRSQFVIYVQNEWSICTHYSYGLVVNTTPLSDMTLYLSTTTIFTNVCSFHTLLYYSAYTDSYFYQAIHAEWKQSINFHTFKFIKLYLLDYLCLIAYCILQLF